MPQRAGVVAAVVALGLSLAAAGTAVFGAPVYAERLAGPPPSWHPGATPAAPPPVLAGAGTQSPMPTPAGLAAALAPLLAAPGLGNHTVLSVTDAVTGRPLYSVEPDAATLPASTTKIVTGSTALAARGPAYRIPTRVVAGPNPGEVVLVAGGDPTLAAGPVGTYPGAARLDELAAAVQRALGNTRPTKVIYDGSAYAGSVYGPGWDPDVATGGFGGPITALMTDGGRVNPRQARGAAARHGQPDAVAAQYFARALGVPPAAAVPGVATPGTAEIARVESPPLVRLVELMMTESDNVIAESLARQVAIAKGQPGTFAGGAAAMRSVLEGLGIPVAGYNLSDGSGLSRLNRLSPALLTAILAASVQPARPNLRALLTGLPVAGYTGTLSPRYHTPAAGGSAAGVVRAKTGTLSGVSALAGLVVSADGRMLAFAALADQNKGTGAAQEALDRIAAAIAACGCRA